MNKLDIAIRVLKTDDLTALGWLIGFVLGAIFIGGMMVISAVMAVLT